MCQTMDFIGLALWTFAKRRSPLLWFADDLLPVAQRLTDRADGLMALFNGSEDLLFSEKVCISFNHEDRIFCPCQKQIEPRFFLLFKVGLMIKLSPIIPTRTAPKA